MSVQTIIEDKLTAAMECRHLELVNESSMHNVPPGSESHFKLVLVSPEFGDLTLLRRHRRINDILQDELAGPVHALAIHAYTPEEWRQRHGDAPLSPPCRGGGR